MKILGGTTFGLAGVLAVILSMGALSQAMPAAAANPGIATRTEKVVAGVDGSSMSVVQLDPSLGDRLTVMTQLAPFITNGDGSTASVAAYRIDRSVRRWIQSSGVYCKDKSGGMTFIANGAPTQPGLTC